MYRSTFLDLQAYIVKSQEKRREIERGKYKRQKTCVEKKTSVSIYSTRLLKKIYLGKKNSGPFLITLKETSAGTYYKN